jgi:maltose 6'-phosphate phosphatase
VDDVRESRVVFNPLVDPSQPTVSDHAGVFVSIELP